MVAIPAQVRPFLARDNAESLDLVLAPHNRESHEVTSSLFRSRYTGLLVGALIASAAQAQVAGIHVPAGAQVQLDGGELRVGCVDLSVAGVFNADSGRVGVLDSLLVDPGGQFALGSATLGMGGDLLNAGTFSAGSGRAEFGDDCAASSRIVGVDGFHALSIRSSIGKRFLLVAGRTLQISGALQIAGVDGQNVRVESDPIAEPSYIRMAAGAALELDHVNLRAGNVHLLGIGPPPAPRPQVIPAGSSTSLLILALLTATVAAFRLRRH